MVVFGADGHDIKGSVPRCCIAQYHLRHTTFEKLDDVELHTGTTVRLEDGNKFRTVINVKYRNGAIIFMAPLKQNIVI